MLARTAAVRRLVLIRMDSGEDILHAIRKAVEENDIQTGAILSGAGSVSRYRAHVVETTNLPPGNAFFEEEGPFDILTVTGFVIDGRVHAHITLSNTQRALGGHLEEGCLVLTFAVVVLAETAGVELTKWDKIGPL